MNYEKNFLFEKALQGGVFGSSRPSKSILIFMFLFLFFAWGFSYALWQMTLLQESSNVVNTACFKINFKDQNEINLQSAYPISDVEGMKLTPYTFMIENICNTTAFYQVNLEELKSELKKLSNEYVKVSLSNSNGKILNTYTEVDKTIANASVSHRLTSGSLKEKESKTFELRLWLDENTPATSDVMNATLKSKITIIAIQKEDLENEFTEENKSLNEDFSNKKETIEFKAVSKDYNIIEKSEDNVIYNPLDEPSKEVAISKTYTIDGTYSMYFKDEVGNIIESTAETTKLDQVDPIVNFIASEYQDGIKVDASSSSDEKSGIKSYYYKLNENDYVESTSSSHTFTGLNDGIYKVNVKVEDRAGNMSVEKELDITVAYEKVYVSSSGNDSSGNGSLVKPYATLQRAYNKVKSGGNILLLSDITATSTITMNTSNKVVTLKSYGSSVYSISKSPNLTTYLLRITNSNQVTMDNIIFDGKQVGSTLALIGVLDSTLNLNDGAIVQNALNLSDNSSGGGLVLARSTLNINGGIVRYNTLQSNSWAQGGGIHATTGSIINMYEGSIIYNKVLTTAANAYAESGAIHLYEANLNLYGGVIARNQAQRGGAICVVGATKPSIMNMENGQITNNTATIFGGGIVATRTSTSAEQGIIYLKKGVIENNQAPLGTNAYIVNGAQIIGQI